MNDLISDNFKNYELLDSGEGKKLENIAGVLVERPSPQAIWPKKLKEVEWGKANSVCIRKKDGGGTWIHKNNKEPKGLLFHHQTLQGEMLSFKLKFTSFGHCGVFFEQIAVWNCIEKKLIDLKQKKNRPLKFLNLFGYTGCASLVALNTQAEVFHVDSSKGVLSWCLENAELNHLNTKNLKLIQDDVLKFVRHSQKKGFKYDGILLDPPSWGHGANKEVWEFELMIAELINHCCDILDSKDSFIFFSCHTHGVQKDALKNLLQSKSKKTQVTCGDLVVRHHTSQDERLLPAGIYTLGVN